MTAAGDQGDAAGEQPLADVARLAVVGSRAHPRGQARPLLLLVAVLASCLG